MAEIIHIHIQNLLLSNAGKSILHIPTAKIPIDTITCIVGPNGSGKTSLLKAITGLIKVSKETISIPNLNTCMVLQGSTVLKMSVKNNLLLLRDAKKSLKESDIINALKKFELLGHSNFPATHLSSGEKQRLALARAYLLGADLILLDEPTSSLDPTSCQLIESYIVQMSTEGKRFLIVSHDFAQVERLSQHIVFIANNRLQKIQPTRAVF
jgi:tungstate transport system ATP-binding protein